MEFEIKEFKGPLDLLLQLVRREEMDIFDIDIHKITDQYLHVLATHPVLDLKMAGDFVKMAATLIYIKSRSLFPTPAEEAAEEAPAPESTEAGVRHYQIPMLVFKALGKKLYRGSVLGRDVWSRKHPDLEKESVKTRPSPCEKLLFSLLKAYRRVDQRIKTQTGLSQKPSLPLLSECILSFSPHFEKRACFNMDVLIPEGVKDHPGWTLVAFLSLLELSRQGHITLEQEKASVLVRVKNPLSKQDMNLFKEQNWT